MMKCLIVGCQRSGTTLLREVLSAGSILIFDESWIAAYFHRERFHANQWRSQSWGYDDENTQIWDQRVRNFLKFTYQSYFEKDRKPRHRYWGMKSPGLNMACTIPYLAKLFDHLKFVYLVRDPRDTFASMKGSHQMMNHLPDSFYENSINSPDLVNLSVRPLAYWSLVNQEILMHRRLMPDRFYTLHFEKWIADPTGFTSEVCRFLEIPFHTGMLEPFTRRISQASVVSMRKEDFESGNYVTRATPSGRWQRDLLPEDVDSLMGISGPTAQELGYA